MNIKRFWMPAAVCMAAMVFTGGGCFLFSFGDSERDVPAPLAPTGPTIPPERAATTTSPSGSPNGQSPQTRPVTPGADVTGEYAQPRIDATSGKILELKMVEVNGEQLTMTDLLESIRPELKALKSAYRMPSDFTAAARPRLARALRSQVTDMLLLQKAKDTLEEHEFQMISRRVVDRLARDRQDRAGEDRPPMTRRQFEEHLRRKGTNIYAHRKRIHDQLTIQTLIRKEMLPQIMVRPSEALANFKRRVRQGKYESETTITQRTIVFYFKNDKDRLLKRKLAEAALAELKSGKPFADVARTRSEELADKGGLWAKPVRKSSLLNQRAEALFALKEGEYSGIVETRLSLNILFCEKRNKPTTFEEVQEEIVENLRRKKIARYYDRYVRKLWDKAFISDEMYQRSTDPFITAAIRSLLQP